ncbi:hypothetical protein FF100_15365 [Methylobacterium terricola]|uniref:Uncharacterized protein n=1 Tax=Methylobacterium terricola TaxID=2583531 RepID=A0A5C4LJB7_9HYPH|nr:hypothetical protein [Methylobacterium terricola]TNC12994.1 hypothetical protein FF100_15365 [Methylobacterium terricola]
MSNAPHCATEDRAPVRELEPHELDDVSGGKLYWNGGKVVGFEFQVGSFSVGELPVAGGASYNFWSTPFGSGSYWAK